MFIKTKNKIIVGTDDLISTREVFTEEQVIKYQEEIRSGGLKYPITVQIIQFLGYLVKDGNHRLEAVKREGLRKIEAEVF